MAHYFFLYTSTETDYHPSRHRPAWIYSQESAWKGSVSDFYVLHYYNGMFHEHIQTTVSWKKDQYKISPFSHFLFLLSLPIYLCMFALNLGDIGGIYCGVWLWVNECLLVIFSKRVLDATFIPFHLQIFCNVLDLLRWDNRCLIHFL